MPEQEQERDFLQDTLEIQVRFAQTVMRVKDINVETALKDYTSVYKRFGRTQGQPNESWSTFLDEIQSEDPLEVARKYFKDNREKRYSSALQNSCFTYHYDEDSKSVHVHFGNKDTSGVSPLDAARIPFRKEELKRMFTEIQSKHPNVLNVKGGSWLYSLDKYCRLFPPEYAASRTPSTKGLTSTRVWGQFVDYNGRLKETMVREFLDKLSRAHTEDEALEAFQFKSQDVECGIRTFYDFYGI